MHVYLINILTRLYHGKREKNNKRRNKGLDEQRTSIADGFLQTTWNGCRRELYRVNSTSGEKICLRVITSILKPNNIHDTLHLMNQHKAQVLIR